MTNNSNNNGHREPPKEHQYRKGQSGNRSGRPKKKVNEQASAFDFILNRSISVVKDGSYKELSAEEAMQHQIFNSAMAGDAKAIKEVLRWIEISEKYSEKLQAKVKPPEAKVRMEQVDPDNIYEVMEILDIAHKHTDSKFARDNSYRTLLEPWVVQFALSRRRGGSKLTEDDINWLKITTKDPEFVKWPGGNNHGR